MEAFAIKSRLRSLLRSPSIKLRKNRHKESLSGKVTLEKVLGITTAGNSGLTCDPCSGTVAYPAGCVVVLLNPAKNTQQHLINSSRKAISALAFSSDGRYLVTGESGHQAAVCVWDVSEGSLVSELMEHKYGVSCVAFSPNDKHIVSVGSQHDMSVHLWAWKKNALIAVNKVSSKVTSVSFSEDGNHFVTAGNRHVRFWYLEPSHADQRACPVPLTGRSGLLGELHNNFFCAVACGRGSRSSSTFCVTASGLLCEFNRHRVLDRWVHLQTGSAHSLAVTEDLIFCACSSGVVRVFGASDLSFICTLPRPHHLGTDVSSVTHAGHLFSRSLHARYPASVAVTFDPVHRWLSCVYDDHSLYVWDTRDLCKVGKVHSALYHSAGVWDLQHVCDLLKLQTCSRSSEGSASFLTCSSDGSVRFWTSDGLRCRNVLSNDLHHIFYVNASALPETEGTAEGSSSIRTICISPDGRHLASGDRNGTLRIHDLKCMKELLKAEVHNSEIVCLEYSKPASGMNLLVTAGRDRLIRVLDADEDYGLLQTLDDHSSSVTSVRFAAGGDGKLRIISCGADKSVYIHTALRTARGAEFKRTHHVVRKATPNDMDVDPTCKYAAVGCQDHSIRVFNISSGKQKRCFSGARTEDGAFLKVQIDPSGLFVASSCSEKNISLIDLQTGERLASAFGHSELITALRFSSDCRHLLSSSADSCIFVWRLAPELTINMKERLSVIRHSRGASSARNPFRRSSVTGFMLHRSTSIMSCSSESDREEEEEEEEEEDMRTAEETERPEDIHQRTEDSVDEETGGSDEMHWRPVKAASSDSSSSAVVSRPRRRWSCRVGSLELMVKSMLELRQLDSLSEAPDQSRSCADRLRDEDRCSTSSLQDCRLRRPRRSAWLLPAGAPEPEGVLLYPDHCPSTSSLPGTSYQIQTRSESLKERAEEAQSPVSGASMGYCSGGSSPDPRHLDTGSDEESCDTRSICGSESVPEDVWRSSETLSDAGSQTTAEGSFSSGLHGQKFSSRSVSGPGPLRSHPYLSSSAAGLQKSASAHSRSHERRSLARPVRSRLSLEKVESRSYMSPTTSSKAKASRPCESLSVLTSRPPRTPPQEPWTDPSSSSSSSSSSSAMKTPAAPDDEGVKRRRSSSVLLLSVPLLLPLPHSSGLLPLCFSPFFSLSFGRRRDSDGSVSLELCRRAAEDLCSSVRSATRIYRTLSSHDAERSAEQQQMCQLMSEALLLVRSELDSVSGPQRREEGHETLALLEQYSQLLLRSVEKRLHQNT
ncbi:mitogen-activated protein kinase-binding protein 1-like [Puntigrus tetrazona]|uniref:mitogen-activated protein kinase-binding protein 1-like n=1 Tax=Puntigrus tetrazona TaxID=1606681 RepID=UPI001C897172|nr:mitogen-activated protein kinase-binding protein 1-like [Puntigrus tetrazona]